jgi:N-methylhydantoinase A
MRVATDVGGTFTDLVFFDETGPDAGVIHTVKTDTTPPDFDLGVMDAVLKARLAPDCIGFFAHGTTAIINALTERNGAVVGLITTKGFRDIVEIARGNRPDFFNLRYLKPPPFVPRYLRREVPGRLNFKGEELTPIDLSPIPGIVASFREHGVEAVAICLLHSYANTTHEEAVLEAVCREWPEVSVIASHQIIRSWREYERCNTAILSAYVQPTTDRYLSRLESRLSGAGFNGRIFIMQSNGGVENIEAARKTPITLVESGPASGVLGAAALGRLIGEKNIIALDIGGTTAKCSLIENGNVHVNTSYAIERDRFHPGYPLLVSVVDIVEIGNGGGSIVWADEDHRLHVGPQSAGAVPGPVAYRRGGNKPTTTDANLFLGRINPDFLHGGEIKADMAGVQAAFYRLGGELGISCSEAARGVVRIANNNMINALKLVSLNRGYDPRDFTLLAFGGGGGMHAAMLAVELAVPRVIVPVNSGVFSAWGMLMSDLRRDYVQTYLTILTRDSIRKINQMVESMERMAIEALVSEGISRGGIQLQRMSNIRYYGQEHSVTVALPAGTLDESCLEEIVSRFKSIYEREYSYRLDNEVEFVGVHLTAFGAVGKSMPQPMPLTDASPRLALKGKRSVDFDVFGIHQADIYDRDKLQPGMRFNGAAVIEDAGSTILVLPDQLAKIDAYRNIHIATGNADSGSGGPR